MASHVEGKNSAKVYKIKKNKKNEEAYKKVEFSSKDK